jgi:hypothetical protein
MPSTSSNLTLMKQPEYTEGPEAQENFERGMKALFRVPKPATKKGKQKDRPNASQRKPKSSDKD